MIKRRELLSAATTVQVMPNDSKHEVDPSQPVVYQIRIKCHLDAQWADWFSGLSVTLEENGDTLLTGPVADQAALFGLIRKVRDLGMPLVSVNHIGPGAQQSRWADKSNIEKRRNEMNEKKQYTVDLAGKWISRVGGIAAFLLVIGWFLSFPFYAAAGGPEPLGAEARLIHYAGHETAWWTILWLMVLTDFLYVVVVLGLYQSLKRIDQSMMMLAVACKGLFIVLDLGVLWPNHAALFNLSTLYTAAVSEVQKAVIVNAAAAPSAVLDSLLPNLYSIVIPSLGTLFASLAMFKGVFSKRTAYLGLGVGVTGIVAFADPFMGAWGKMHIVNALLATVWFLLVGWQLYKLGKG